MSLSNNEIINSPIMTEEFKKSIGLSERNGKLYFNDISKKERLFNFSNGSAALELFGSNLLAYTLFSGDSKSQLEFWETEYQIANETNNFNRSDFITKGANGKVSAIWENKYLDSNSIQQMTFESQIEKAKNQVLNRYVKELKETDKINDEIFLTIAVVDTLKMIKNPEKIVKYKNSSRDEKNNSYKLFQNTGIYIETFKLDVNKIDSPYPYIDYKDPQNNRHQPPQILKFYSKNDENSPFNDKRNQIRVGDAVKIHTCTLTRHGIANIRDIIDRLDQKKKELTKNIFATAFRQFLNKERDNENWLISKHTQSKSFVVIEEETYFTEEDYINNEEIQQILMDILMDKNKTKEEKAKLIKIEMNKKRVERRVLSTNSALIDGQNSLDSLYIILEFLSSPGSMNNPDFKEIKKDFISITESISKEKNKSFDIREKRDELKKYIEDAEIHIEISTAKNIEEARRMARNKNFSNEVNKGDLLLAENKDACIEINSKLFESFGIFAKFPKIDLDDFLKENKEITELIIDIKKLAKILYTIDGIGKNIDYENYSRDESRKEIKQILKLSDAIGSPTIAEEHVKFLENNYTYIIESELDGKITKGQEEDLKHYKELKNDIICHINYYKGNIVLKLESKVNDTEFEKKEIKKLEKELNEIDKKISLIYNVCYIGKNINKAAVAASIYKKIHDIMNEKDRKNTLETKIKNMSSADTRKKLKIEKISDFAFGFIISNIKSELMEREDMNIEDFFENVENKSSLNNLIETLNLEELTVKFSERFIYLMDYYSLGMTDLRFNQTRQENGKIIRDQETGKSTDDIREEMFSIFPDIRILNSSPLNQNGMEFR